MHRLFFVVVVGICAASAAHANQPAEIRALFDQLIDSPDLATVRRQIKGKAADQIQSRLRTKLPIFIQLKKLESLPQVGCAKVSMEVLIPGFKAMTKTGEMAEFAVPAVNYRICKGGAPPVPESMVRKAPPHKK